MAPNDSVTTVFPGVVIVRYSVADSGQGRATAAHTPPRTSLRGPPTEPRAVTGLSTSGSASLIYVHIIKNTPSHECTLLKTPLI